MPLKRSHNHQKGYILICAMLMLLITACSGPEQAPLQTAAAELGQTAVAEGKKLAQTEVAQLKETAVEVAKTQAAQLKETAVAAVTQVTHPTYTIDSNLTELAIVTGPDLDNAIKAIRPDSPLIGLGQTFVDVGKKEGINAFYIAAHAAWESTWGTSALAKDKNNLFGYGAYNSCPYECALTFKTKAECVETVMALIKVNYLTEGGKYYNGSTLRGMNTRYATDQNWKNGIVKIMNSLASKIP